MTVPFFSDHEPSRGPIEFRGAAPGFYIPGDDRAMTSKVLIAIGEWFHSHVEQICNDAALRPDDWTIFGFGYVLGLGLTMKVDDEDKTEE